MSEDTAGFDLNSLNFGPSWAREDDKKKEKARDNFPGNKREDTRKHRNSGNQNNRRQTKEPYRKEGWKDTPRRRSEPVKAPEGYEGGIMPVEQGLDNIAQEIAASGRTYSIYDVAKTVMGNRERFQFTVKAPEGKFLYRVKKDSSLWLSKKELIAHFLKSDWKAELYKEVQVQVDAPSGNYQSVAKCGITGTTLGPPNYHGYQEKLMELYKERFSQMPLEEYKKKVIIEKGEEAVEAWKETMTTQTKYLPIANTQPEAEETEETANQITESPFEEQAPAAETAEPEETASEENDITETLETPAETPEQNEESEEKEPEINQELLLDDKKQLEKHFLTHLYETTVEEVPQAWTDGGIPGSRLSPPLLILLKETVAEERRYPSKLIPILCRQLSGRRLAVFKWNKKLKVGPSRPHAAPSGVPFSERPQKIINWLQEHTGKTIEELWKALLPEDATTEIKHVWYHDLHWLINQGYTLLLSDGTIHLAKAQKQAEEQTNPSTPSPKEEDPPPPQAELTPPSTPTEPEKLSS